MQLRHSIGSRSLVTNHNNDVTSKLTRLERIDHIALGIKHAGRRLYNPVLALYRGYLDDGAP